MLINLLAETTEQNPSGFGYIPFIIIIAVLLIAVMVVFPMITNKRRKKQVEDQLNSLAIGDTVETVGGIIGKLISVRTVGARKEMIIETGTGDSRTTFVVDLQALYAVLEKSGGVPALPNNTATVSAPATANVELKEKNISAKTEKVEAEKTNETTDANTKVIEAESKKDNADSEANDNSQNSTK